MSIITDNYTESTKNIEALSLELKRKFLPIQDEVLHMFTEHKINTIIMELGNLNFYANSLNNRKRR